jgi:hypothetical protein
MEMCCHGYYKNEQEQIFYEYVTYWELIMLQIRNNGLGPIMRIICLLDTISEV